MKTIQVCDVPRGGEFRFRGTLYRRATDTELTRYVLRTHQINGRPVVLAYRNRQPAMFVATEKVAVEEDVQ